MNTPKKYSFDEILEKANTSPEFKEEYEKELARLRAEGWEKEFAQGLISSEAAGGFCRVVNNTPVIQSDLISAFIRTLLSDQRRELREKFEAAQDKNKEEGMWSSDLQIVLKLLKD